MERVKEDRTSLSNHRFAGEMEWTFLYDSRFIDLTDSIRNILWKYPEAPSMITPEECEFITEIIPLLKLFDNMTNIVSSEKNVTISRLYVRTEERPPKNRK